LDRAAEEHVEVFVRDGARVVLVDRGEDGRGGVTRAGVADAGEVGVEVGHGGRFSVVVGEGKAGAGAGTEAEESWVGL
jgi:hypothetical protein